MTILFTDIEGSSALAEALGDDRWLAVLAAHNRIVRDQIAAHGGTEVKTAGDGFMVSFPSARRAVRCAVGIQRAFTERAGEIPGGLPLRVRIGLHTGEVIRDAGDLFGRNVNLAARIAAEARGGEILASELTRQLAEGGADLGFGRQRTIAVKGADDPAVVWTVDWDR